MCSALPACGSRLILLKKRAQLHGAGFWQHLACKSPAPPLDIILLGFLRSSFSEKKNHCCPVCPSLSQWLHMFASLHLSCGWALPLNHSARGEALTMAVAKWSPKIVATSWLSLPHRICHCLSGWIIVVTWAVKKLQMYKYLSRYFCCHSLSQSCGLKVCVPCEIESSPEDSTIL